MATIIETCRDVLKNTPLYEKREKEFYLRQKRKSELLKNSNVHKLRADEIRPKAKNVFNAIRIMDNYSENYAEDMEKALSQGVALLGYALTLAGLLLGTLTKNKQSKKATVIMTLLYMMPMILIPILAAPFTAKKQIQASRAGRYKALKNEISDVRNFVVYTPEQIEQAKNIEIRDKEKINSKNKSQNSFQNTIKTIKDFNKDYSEYKKYKQKTNIKLNEEFEKKLSREYTPDDIAKAFEDKELIHNATKIINNKAEDYSENTENAYATLAELATLISLPIGWGLGSIANKIIKKVPPYMAKLTGMMGSLMFVMVLLVTGTQRQKIASRVGRYMAEKEMQNDLSKVMYFDNEEINSVNIENDYKRRKFFGKIYDNLKYLKKYNKDYKEYKNYKKTIEKEEAKLRKNLKQIEVTPEQLKEAEYLQKKVLFVFDEIDDMSQSYSENIEAATDISYNIFSLVIQLAMYFTPLLLAYKYEGRKFKISKIFNKISNLIFDKNSVIKKSANKIYDVAKTDKKTAQKVDSTIYNLLLGNKDNSHKTDNEILKLIEEPLADLGKKFQELNGNPANLKKEIKQNKFAQYLYDLITDIIKEKERLSRKEAKRLGQVYKQSKSDNAANSITRLFDDGKSEKMGKTLKRTLIIGGIPIASIIFLVPFTIQSWFTNLQKKAGKIGVMKALDNVNDIRYYT